MKDTGSRIRIRININIDWAESLGSRDLQVGHPDVEQVQREREALLYGPDGRVRGDPRHSIQGSVRPVLRLYSGREKSQEESVFRA
jgi:hypothetical protein